MARLIAYPESTASASSSLPRLDDAELDLVTGGQSVPGNPPPPGGGATVPPPPPPPPGGFAGELKALAATIRSELKELAGHCHSD
jgi:hypothetical protein